MASRLSGILSTVGGAIFGKSKPKAADAELRTGVFERSSGRELRGPEVDAALKEAPSAEAFEAKYLVRPRYQEELGPLAAAFVEAALPAILSLLTLPEIASISNERRLLQGYRRLYAPGHLTSGELLDAWRRGRVSEDTLAERLTAQGLNAEDIAALKSATESIPGAQDIIRFAVREALSPEQVKDLDLDADFEPVLAAAVPLLKAVGMSPEVFRLYWRAHWQLPSVTQGFEMRQRGEINDKALDSLLQAQDYAPRWRGLLKAITYNPLTRVDVRRMHKLGLLKDAELSKAYHDLGYSDENAARLTAFTVQANADPESNEETFSDREAARHRDLTASDLLDGLAEGLLSREQVEKALEGLGYSKREHDFMIERALFKQLLADTREIVRALRVGYVTGQTSESTVRADLGKLGLPAAYVEKQLTEWKREVEVKSAVPTKAELLAWLKRGTISRAEAKEALHRLGYSDRWVTLYLEGSAPPGSED